MRRSWDINDLADAHEVLDVEREAQEFDNAEMDREIREAKRKAQQGGK